MILCIITDSYDSAKIIYDTHFSEFKKSNYNYIYFFYKNATITDKYSFFDEELFSKIYLGTFDLSRLDVILLWSKLESIQVYISDKLFEEDFVNEIRDKYLFKRNNITELNTLDFNNLGYYE